MQQDYKTKSNTDVLRIPNDIYNPETNMLNIQKDAVACYVFGSKNNDDMILLLLDALISDKLDGRLESIKRVECTADATGLLSKETKFDFYGVTNNGNPVIIEVQCYDDPNFITRMLLYIARAFSSQFRYYQDQASKEKQDKDINKFFEFAQTFIVTLVYKQIVPDVDLLVENYRFYGDKSKKLLSDKLNATVANFGGFDKKPEECNTNLDYVLSFMKYSYTMDQATLDMMCSKSEFCRVARRAFNWELLSEIEQTEMIGYQMKMAGQRSVCMDRGREEGRREGIAEGMAVGEAKGREAGLAEGEAKGREAGLLEGKEEGIKEAAIESATKMLELGIDDATILKCVKVSKEELVELKDKIKNMQ